MTTKQYKNPLPTVDIIIKYRGGIVLIKRKNPPHGWAIPGGFVDWGESMEAAAVREAKEETGLDVKLIRQFHTYSDPSRDARFHTITTVFEAEAQGEAAAADDAVDLGVFGKENLPEPLAFDHADVLRDFFEGVY